MSRRSPNTRAPWPILVVAATAIVFIALPFIGLLWRAPWSDLSEIISRPSVRDALWLSVRTSLIAALIATLLGVPLAWLLAQAEFPGRRFIRALAILSMVLPPVVGGVALFSAYGRSGLVGEALDNWFGWGLPFTTGGVVVAQVFVAMPFLILTVEGALRQLDPNIEAAARTLGASRWYTFTRVTLPSIRPGLIAGIVLAWARALGEFGATITFAGNFPGRTQTLPLATYLSLDTDPDEAVLISLLLIAIGFSVVVGLRDRWIGGER